MATAIQTALAAAIAAKQSPDRDSGLRAAEAVRSELASLTKSAARHYIGRRLDVAIRHKMEFELYLGRADDMRRVWANVSFVEVERGRRLLIDFEAVPAGLRRGSVGTEYGQIVDFSFTPGSLGAEVMEVWRKHHANDSHPGCRHQRALGWEEERERNPQTGIWRYAHTDEPCPTCGYRFGSKWQYVPLPLEVCQAVGRWMRIARKQAT